MRALRFGKIIVATRLLFSCSKFLRLISEKERVQYSVMQMGNRLAITILSTTSIFALGQASKAPDASAGPVPPAIQQMPSRFQPPVPGCTDCYYTVPTGNVVGAMGTTNNEDIKVTNPRPQPPPIKPKVASSSKRAAPGASGGCKIGYKAITANGKRTCVKK
jgi:hypothetical protein